MKKTGHYLFLGLFLGFLVFAVAQEVDPAEELAKSVERGQELFNDTGLGTSGMSCNSCHKAGGTEDNKMGEMDIPAWDKLATKYPHYFQMAQRVLTLDQVINICITQAMKGEALAWDSQKLTDLTVYCASVKK
ncbi:MAG: cytochrome c peroxidase [Candidatus Aminicenantes bacterium]